MKLVKHLNPRRRKLSNEIKSHFVILLILAFTTISNWIRSFDSNCICLFACLLDTIINNEDSFKIFIPCFINSKLIHHLGNRIIFFANKITNFIEQKITDNNCQLVNCVEDLQVF